jgi:nitrite reductase/ring-hydroxylating ferredoxin subunit
VVADYFFPDALDSCLMVPDWNRAASGRGRRVMCSPAGLMIIKTPEDLRSPVTGEVTMAAQLNFDELVQDERVHRKIYTEAEVFEAEMERIFERTWVFVGHESEVAASGDYKTVTLGTQPAIMTRDEDGGIHLLMNRCMHRGSTICQEASGNSSYFRWWYHGWTYTNRGELVGVPMPPATARVSIAVNSACCAPE